MATRIKPATVKIESLEEKQNREMVETIAENIAALSKSVRTLLDGRLKHKTLFVLLAHSTQLPQSTVAKVIESLAGLEKELLK